MTRTTRLLPAALALALGLALLVGCEPPGDPAPTPADAVEACETARACAVDSCAELEAELFALDETKPDYSCEQICVDSCLDGSVGCDAAAQTACKASCGEQLKSEREAWREVYDALAAVVDECIAGCIAPYSRAEVHSNRCEVPEYTLEDVHACAVGAGALSAVDCAERVECLLAGGPCY